MPHQANQRIIRGVGDRLGLDENKVVSTVALHANTSAASIPLAMDSAIKDGRIKRGDLVVIEAMGGGLTWAPAPSVSRFAFRALIRGDFALLCVRIGSGETQ